MRSQIISEEGCEGGKSKDIAHNYVQQVMSQVQDVQGIKEEVEKRKRDIKIKEKTNKKKTLTVFTPF